MEPSIQPGQLNIDKEQNPKNLPSLYTENTLTLQLAEIQMTFFFISAVKFQEFILHSFHVIMLTTSEYRQIGWDTPAITQFVEVPGTLRISRSTFCSDDRCKLSGWKQYRLQYQAGKTWVWNINNTTAARKSTSASEFAPLWNTLH